MIHVQLIKAQCVFRTSHHQVCVGEHIFGLHQSSSMPRMEKIEDPISVDSHRTIGCKRIHMKTTLHKS